MNFTILFIVVEYIVITYIFGLLYKLVGAKNSKYIQRNFGWGGYCVLGTVGVTFHELAHLITAVIFRHKINDVRLFRPIQGKVDGTLGYVKHSWNSRSIYQKIGNFFIGTSPMFFGAGLLFLLLRIAYPTAFAEVTALSEIPSALGTAFGGMFSSEYLLTWWTPIIAITAIFICPHMDMSWPDIKGATSGAITLTIVAALLSLVSVIMPIGVMAMIQSAMNTFVTYYIYALVLGLIMSIIMTVCFCLMLFIRGRGL
ncbi:MAG: hypothetical protein LBC86_05650 [Oscillospiraceae bacterium]|jgi:hypothetical protein|nr:hypothetical protein [Oscillospiraceae bacterium]